MQLSDSEKAELAEVYEKAAEYLEKYGWCQASTFKGFAGGMGEGNPSCLAIAIGEAGNGLAIMKLLAWKFAAATLELDTYDPFGVVVRWNDEPTRTEDEVINTLHALANKLR